LVSGDGAFEVSVLREHQVAIVVFSDIGVQWLLTQCPASSFWIILVAQKSVEGAEIEFRSARVRRVIRCKSGCGSKGAGV
jgi:hypothetical protein